ncbi:MAG: hypothetical protein RI959_1199, partial [Pseudomonadota bacterium]
MTFTRAATRELSDRIRARLLEAAFCFRSEHPDSTTDPYLHTLLQAYPQGHARKQAGLRLAMAADGMDESSIHTIDAWCQRMLKEHAFDSGSLFDETLEPDEQGLVVEATQDFWRQACYPLAPAQLAEVLSIWANLQAFQKDMRRLLPLVAEKTAPAP